MISGHTSHTQSSSCFSHAHTQTYKYTSCERILLLQKSIRNFQEESLPTYIIFINLFKIIKNIINLFKKYSRQSLTYTMTVLLPSYVSIDTQFDIEFIEVPHTCIIFHADFPHVREHICSRSSFMLFDMILCKYSRLY